MKHLLGLIFLFLFSIPSFCQPFENISKKPAVFELFSVGDSIQKFNNSLSCGHHSSDVEIVDLNGRLSCKVFQYLPARKDSVDIGGVKFPNVLLFPDSLKLITAISFHKSYLNNDTIDPWLIAQKDYSKLEEFITLFLQSKAKKYKEDHKKREPIFGLIWIKDGNKYLLRKYDLAKRKKKISQILTLDVSKSD